ncbi:MAG: hypothetical protein ABSB57_03585 [Dehalococcoidia bacterium]
MKPIRLIGLGLAVLVVLAVLAGKGTPAYAWSYPAALNTNAATDSGTDWSPQVATDGKGHWVAVWESDDDLGGTIGTDEDILVARSTNNGATWTAPAALNTNAATDSGWDFGPQVTTDGAGHWLAVWWSNDSLGGTIGIDEDILVARSTNNGATWTAPAPLNSYAATDSAWDGYPQVATDGAGHWLAVWKSGYDLGGTIGTDGDILAARSTNNGVTWTAAAPLNTNAATDSGEDWLAQVTTDGGGNWLAVWQSLENLGGTIGTDWDILVARSTDNGATWTYPAALNTNAATDSGADDAPEVATDGDGNWVTVWWSFDSLEGTIGTDSDILVARSTDNGATWTAPAALNSNAATDSGEDRDAEVATDGRGNWLAVWWSDDDLGATIAHDFDILVARSTDNGATWTDPAPLNANAATDSGHDWEPQVTSDGSGNWVAVWRSSESPDNPWVTESDILYATCSALDADCDGVADAADADPLDPFACQDLDSDTCDDCSLLGMPDPSRDGTDTDSDGACDAGDPDDDNDSQGLGDPLLFRDEVEGFVGTDPLDACPDSPSDAAWPPDFNNSGAVTSGDLVLFAQHYMDLATYSARYDLNASGPPKITSGDLVIFAKYYVGTGHDTCTNP